ncbi:hypothetical protein COU60_01530 [Candidatus Pacearchaeota archaeon CG10_big_fil_rev_8_21_14_0_10_34_76]|nr:MAG: hypothetical protein COU60_01530 [Candidatus Pacearchaeota archaeon CG10_big_fil_rev_8_21_14_0_10_34_76]
MEDKCVFIIDEEILNKFSLLESQGEGYYEGENAQLFFEYLSYRIHNKKAFMIPSIYKKITSKLKINDGESLAYFKNWVKEGDIGESSDTTEEQDTISLFETLEVLHEKVFIISDKYEGNTNFRNIPVLTMDKLNKYLKDKKEFMKYINDCFYGQGY